MKALQEKRISLRSLWRRSLVIFSVIALAFTFGACNQTVDPGNGEGPPEPPPLQSTPIAISIIRAPANAGGIVFEGLPVDLTGIQASVRFSDHTWRVVGADELTVYPPVYTVVNRFIGTGLDDGLPITVLSAVGAPDPGPAPVQAVGGTIIRGGAGVTSNWAGYIISFRSNSVIVSTIIDTLPAGAGTTAADVIHSMGTHRPLLQVHYTGTLATQDFYIDQLPSFAGVVVEGVYWGGTTDIPLFTVDGTHPPFPGAGQPGTQATFVQRNIPISASIYPWAWVWNRAGALATWYVGDDPGVLVQIGSFGDLHEDNWLGSATGLRGLRIPVRNIWQVIGMEIVTPPTIPTLFHDDPRFFPDGIAGVFPGVQDRWITEVLGDAVVRLTYSGGGITREWTVAQLATLSPEPVGQSWQTGPRARFWENLYFTLVDRRGDFFPGVGDSDPASLTGSHIGRWTQEANPRVALRFRGVQALQEIPVFNRLESIEVVARAGEGVVPIMEGRSTVYRRPDNATSFLRDHVRVIATYSLGSDRSITATREDVRADQHANPARIRPRSEGISLTVGGTSGDALVVTNMGAIGGNADGDNILGILNATTSDQFLSRDRLQRASVSFMSESASTSPEVIGARQRTVRFDVGVRGYTAN